VAALGLRKSGFVDRPVSTNKSVIGPVKLSAGIDAMLFGPAFVLRLKHAAGTVSEPD
jgi:hypothetical protein